jgi:hypothetical protein
MGSFGPTEVRGVGSNTGAEQKRFPFLTPALALPLQNCFPMAVTFNLREVLHSDSKIGLT